MFRLVKNPPNPYTSRHREYLEPPPKTRIDVYQEHARTILSRNDSPDVPFEWSMNPYRGCQHACAYCYARPTHEYLELGAGTDFDSRLFVKVNAPQLLDKELSRRSWTGACINFSGVTDCYQPLEAVWCVTRKCLEVCLKHCNPLAIVTKSYLVVRDIELLAEIQRVARVTVFVSIPFAERQVSDKIEPQAPPPARRFEAMQQLSQAGLRVGVMVAPIIPGLNDRDIPAILERAAECGAQVAASMALRLPGSVQAVFRQRLREGLPERARRVENRIREMRGGHLNETAFGKRMTGEGPYWRSIAQLFSLQCRRLRLATDDDHRREGPRRPAALTDPQLSFSFE